MTNARSCGIISIVSFCLFKLILSIVFIESCFLDTPESAAKLTQLRIAKEINPEILAKYNVLKQVEPSRIYHKV